MANTTKELLNSKCYSSFSKNHSTTEQAQIINNALEKNIDIDSLSWHQPGV